MNTNDNRLKAHKLIDHIFQDLLPAHGMAQRPEQIQLSHRMLDAMQDGRIALCDAGTGIGKTYAYLAAATAASAFPTGQIARPIIISTSSIALQNAVLTEYLPLLSCVLMADGILTKPLKAVIRKGKSHYVCDERLDRRLRQVYPAKKNPEALTALRTLRETLDMDRVSHLSGYDRERVCVPQVCDCKQRDCRYQRFLKTCDKDQFLFQICNHNLLVADAIHRSEGKRPIFPEHSIIIVDEAHKLPETAQQMLGVTLAAEEIRNLILQLKEERYLLAAEMLEDSTGPLRRKLAQPREEAEPVEACLRLLTAPSCTLPIIQRQIGSLLSPLGSRQLNIIDRDTFERVQALLQKKAQKEKKRREKSPLALKIVCGNCGTVFQRRSSQNGYVTWVCRTHDRHAADCPVGRIPETEIHAAFLRMYHRLKSNADIILAPALRQLNTLGTILRQNHPQVLAINRAIAEATEESHKISTLRANGLLDADICAARMNAISARLAQLRGERRRLTENEAIDETMDALRKVEQTLLNGPERLDGFDEELFERLVEKIIAESQNRIRFRL